MPKILVDLSDEEDRVVYTAKSINGLKNKNQAIKFIILDWNKLRKE